MRQPRARTTPRTPPSSLSSVDRHAARSDWEKWTPDTNVAPLARPATWTLPLIGTRATVKDGPTPIQAGDPLAIAPDDHRLHEALMLNAARHGAGHYGTGFRFAHRHHAGQAHNQKGKDRPNQSFAHAPLP